MRPLLLISVLLCALAARADPDPPVVFDEDPPEEDTPRMPPAQAPDEFVGPPEPPGLQRPPQQGGDNDAGSGLIPGGPVPDGSRPGDETPSGETYSGSDPGYRYSGGSASNSPASPAAASAASSAASGQKAQSARGRSSGASKAASRMAEQMKKMMPGADAGGLGGAGDALKKAAAAAGALPGAGKLPGAPALTGAAAAKAGAPSPSPFVTFASPGGGQPSRTPEAAAYMGPFKSLAESRGLSAYQAPDGSVAFRRRDGSPASESEVASLREAAAKEPGALTKYPNFFQSVSRENYDQLRGDFSANSGRPQYKDIGMTEDPRRDLVWTRSCEKLSGDCNPLAAEDSYKKNDYVSPKSAASLWDDLFAIADEEERRKEQERLDAQVGGGLHRPRISEELAAELGGEAAAEGAPTGEGAPAAPGTPEARAAASAKAAAAASPAAKLEKVMPAILWRPSAPGQPSRPSGLAYGLIGLMGIALAWKLTAKD